MSDPRQVILDEVSVVKIKWEPLAEDVPPRVPPAFGNCTEIDESKLDIVEVIFETIKEEASEWPLDYLKTEPPELRVKVEDQNAIPETYDEPSLRQKRLATTGADECAFSKEKNVKLAVTQTHKKRFRCTVCGHKTKLKRDIVKHLARHSIPFKRSQSDVRDSKLSRGREDVTRGDHCGSVNSGRQPLKRDRSRGDGRQFGCDLCPKVFRRKFNLNEHLAAFHFLVRFKCHVCGRIFNSNVDLVRHIQVHQTDKPYKCKACHVTFRASEELQRHWKSHPKHMPHVTHHTPSKADRMVRIGKRFRGFVNSRSPVRDSKCPPERPEKVAREAPPTAEGSYHCNYCSAEFERVPLLAVHMQEHQTGPLRTCAVCKTGFDNKYDMSMHMKSHDTAEPDECQLDREGSKLERPNDAGECQYSCDVCHAQFRLSSDLLTHTGTHTENETDKKRSSSPSFHVKQTKDVFKLLGGALHHAARDKENNPSLPTPERIDQDPYECQICNQKFTSQIELQTHMIMHTFVFIGGDKPFRCPLCRQPLASKRFLEVHIKKVHVIKPVNKRYGKPRPTSEPYKCEVCMWTFLTPHGLQAHMMVHAGEMPCECEDCQKSFCSERNSDVPSKTDTVESAMRNSTATDSNVKQHKCGVCDLQFITAGGLRRHTMNHSGQKPYKCEMCQEMFDRKRDFELHSDAHAAEDSEKRCIKVDTTSLTAHKCELCELEFTTFARLRRHLKTHIRGNLFQCEVCQTKFNSKSNYDLHSKFHKKLNSAETDSGAERYDSGGYESEILTPQGTQAHTIADAGGKPYQCEVYQETFDSKRTFKGHAKMHSVKTDADVAPSKSKVSKSQRKPSKGVREHLEIRPWRNPYQCDVCNETLGTKKQWTLHTRIHLTENIRKHSGPSHADVRPYECSICLWRFKLHTSLRNHQIVHTEKKPYQCDVCQKWFRRKGNLLSHFKRHAKENTENRFTEMDTDADEVPESELTAQTQMKARAGKDPHQNEMEEEKFDSEPNFDLHSIIHTFEDALNDLSVKSDTDGVLRESDVCEAESATSDAPQAHVMMPAKEEPCENDERCNIEPNFDLDAQMHDSEDTKINWTIKSGTDVVIYKCEVCEVESATPHDLQDHMLTHYSREPYQNEMDEERPKSTEPNFDLRTSVRTFEDGSNDYIRSDTGTAVYESDICQVEPAIPRSPEADVVMHAEKEPCQSETDKERFDTEPNFVVHPTMPTLEDPENDSVKSVTDVDRYKCKFCEVELATSFGLQAHTMIHSGEKPYRCNVCHEKFVSLCNFEEHTQTHIEKGDTRERPYKCEVCNSMVGTFGNLRKHMIVHTETRPYQCSVCYKTFKRKDHLDVHSVTHIRENDKKLSDEANSDAGSHKCAVCNRTFKTYERLRTHVMVHTGDKVECDLCTGSFSKKRLKKHRETHARGKKSGRKSFKCQVCNKMFGLSDTLKRHMKTHTGEKPFKCGMCQRGFTRKTYLDQHMKIYATKNTKGHLSKPNPVREPELPHTEEAPYQCELCKETFVDKRNFEEHTKMHTKKTDTNAEHYKCKFCALSFTLFRALRKHMLNHSEKKLHKCNVCQRSFGGLNNLRQHARVHEKKSTKRRSLLRHTDSERSERVGFGSELTTSCDLRTNAGEEPYQCELGKKTFVGKRDLEEHAKIHTNVTDTNAKLYKCKRCNSTFALLKSFRKHMLIHSGGKWYKCNVCQKTFNGLNYLQVHTRMHIRNKTKKPSNAERYKCEVCEEELASCYGLEAHMIIHSRDTPYWCEVCHRRFASKRNFERHGKIHYRTDPDLNRHKCPICDTKLSSDVSLRRHMLIHTGERPYKCHLCRRGFARSDHLFNHIKIHSTKTTKDHFVQSLPNVGNYKWKNRTSKYTQRRVKIHASDNAENNLTQFGTSFEPYKCRVCDAEFTASCNMRRHMVMHAGEKPYKCNVCETGFYRKYRLYNHYTVHSVEDYRNRLSRTIAVRKSLACQLCKSEFDTLASLRAHMTRHAIEDKQYQCYLCEKAYATKRELAQHAKMHIGKTEAKPHKCKICNAGYAASSGLKKHMLIHTGKKQHQCDECQKSFYRKDHLLEHINGHIRRRNELATSSKGKGTVQMP